MIWVILALLVVLMLTGFASALLKPAPRADEGLHMELEQCKAGLARIDNDIAEGRLTEAAADEARLAIERRVLALAKREPIEAGPRRNWQRFMPFAALIALSVAGLYMILGAPDFQKRAVYLPGATLPSGQTATISSMTAQLSDRLAKEPDAPLQVYLFLARAQWGDGQREAAIQTYEAAAARFPGVPVVQGELAQMRAMLTGAAPQISEDQRSAIASMTPEQQAEMIGNMVAGLAARLKDNPENLEGWARLIRARTVMGNIDQAQADLASARATFAKDDEALIILDQIAAANGLAE